MNCYAYATEYVCLLLRPSLLLYSQAKEIGGLLTRLTNENAAFLKLKDAAAAARDEALNRVTALEMEVEMLQQQLRCAALLLSLCTADVL
jgi:hypothetical protein